MSGFGDDSLFVCVVLLSVMNMHVVANASIVGIKKKRRVGIAAA